jgi:hypothetical protein
LRGKSEQVNENRSHFATCFFALNLVLLLVRVFHYLLGIVLLQNLAELDEQDYRGNHSSHA